MTPCRAPSSSPPATASRRTSTSSSTPRRATRPCPPCTRPSAPSAPSPASSPTSCAATFDFVHGNAVAGHLFSVASGLESVVVGEGEIAGQVRRSLERARTEGTTTPELERLFQRASQTSRRVKNETGIGSEGRSLVRLALDLAESRITDWAADPRAARRHRALRGRIARRAARSRRPRRQRLLALGPCHEVRSKPRHRGGPRDEIRGGRRARRRHRHLHDRRAPRGRPGVDRPSGAPSSRHPLALRSRRRTRSRS